MMLCGWRPLSVTDSRREMDLGFVDERDRVLGFVVEEPRYLTLVMGRGLLGYNIDDAGV